MTKQRFSRHLHAWRDLGSGQMGGWRYRCALCQRRSRNPYYQLPQFRRTALRDLPPVTTRDDRRAIERRMQRRRAR